MIIITERDNIKDFLKQVKVMDGSWYDKMRPRFADINPETVTMDEMSALLEGHSSYLELKCDECSAVVKLVIQVGEPASHDSATVNLCTRCLQKAFEKVFVEYDQRFKP